MVDESFSVNARRMWAVSELERRASPTAPSTQIGEKQPIRSFFADGTEREPDILEPLQDIEPQNPINWRLLI